MDKNTLLIGVMPSLNETTHVHDLTWCLKHGREQWVVLTLFATSTTLIFTRSLLWVLVHSQEPNVKYARLPPPSRDVGMAAEMERWGHLSGITWPAVSEILGTVPPGQRYRGNGTCVPIPKELPA